MTQRWGIFSCNDPDCGSTAMVADVDVTNEHRHGPSSDADFDREPLRACTASVWGRFGVEQCRGHLLFRGFLNVES
jgi:hypothetical protein